MNQPLRRNRVNIKKRRATTGYFLLIFLSWAGCCQAGAPVLQLPVQCRPGQDCYIQNFYDHDPGPGWKDYTCGHLSYNNHRGTDFALPTLKMMEQGVNVVAAASGTVMAVRDGEPDISIRIRGPAALNGKDAGNSVRIRHAGGWQTQYSHMKRGSVAVRAGEKVDAGSILGQVGLSGNTEFPHLHFSLRFQGRDIDPFAPEPLPCGSGQATLWAPELKKALRYTPTGLLNAGFSTEVPKRSIVDAGDYTKESFANTAPALIFWCVLYGLQQGDRIELQLFDSADRLLYKEQRIAEKHRAVLFAYTGKGRPPENWPPGHYRGMVFLYRKNALFLEGSRIVTVGGNLPEGR